jgi:hypothetical protein
MNTTLPNVVAQVNDRCSHNRVLSPPRLTPRLLYGHLFLVVAAGVLCP